MHVLVSVGSTNFADLVNLVMGDEVLGSLKAKGAKTILIQAGESQIESIGEIADPMIEIRSYILGIEKEIERADLLICHGGAGIIIEALRLGKRIIAVPNESLVGNHQVDFVSRMEKEGYITKSDVSVKGLLKAITAALAFVPNIWAHNGPDVFSNMLCKVLYG